MSRPKHPNLAPALAAVQSGMMPAEAARVYGIAKSSISRAMSAVICPCCDSQLSGKRLAAYKAKQGS